MREYDLAVHILYVRQLQQKDEALSTHRDRTHKPQRPPDPIRHKDAQNQSDGTTASADAYNIPPEGTSSASEDHQQGVPKNMRLRSMFYTECSGAAKSPDQEQPGVPDEIMTFGQATTSTQESMDNTLSRILSAEEFHEVSIKQIDH